MTTFAPSIFIKLFCNSLLFSLSSPFLAGVGWV